MEASIYIETHDIATLKKHDVPLVRLHFQTQPRGIEGVNNIEMALLDIERKLWLAKSRFNSGEEIYGEWL